MTIIRPNSKPPFWWLFPWAYACELHRAANAVKAYADKADRDILHQKAVIESHKDAGLRMLAMLDEERRLTKHLKAEVELLTDAITRGAINPDAQPHE
jgi:hypothetical protein